VDDDRAVELLEAMLRIPSLCGEEDALATMLLKAMSDAGFAASRDEVGNVIGRVGPAGAARTIVVLGHMDTVPGAIAVERRDGALYGRGAVDAKGPLAAAIVAASRARTALRVTVIGAVQEEGPSLGARHLASLPAPDFLIIAEPSGWDSVVLGYKGSLRFTVRITQPASHSAGREPTAAERLVAFWNELSAWCAAQSPPRDDSADKGGFNHLTATLIAVASSGDGLRDEASMRIGLRLPPGISIEIARQGAEALLPQGGFDFQPGEEAVRSGKGTPLVAAFLRAIRSQGGTPRFKVKTGTSDMNVVGPVWRCPMVAYGPGDSNLDHTPNEHIVLDEYLRAVGVLRGVLEGI